MKTIVNTLLVVLAVVTMLSVTAMVSAQKDAEEATETAKTSIDYALPYPGILPGHPLYSVKMLRDRVMGWFITDPLKKAEFYLLLADKRINAGQFLVNYGKQQLGELKLNLRGVRGNRRSDRRDRDDRGSGQGEGNQPED